MANRKVLFGVGAGIVSLGVDGVAGLLMLRLLRVHLAPNVAGYWVLATSAGAILMLVQGGLGPTITRAVAQALSETDTSAMSRLLRSILRVYGWIFGLIITAGVLIQVAYLGPIATRDGLGPAAVVAWHLYLAGIALNLLGQGYLFVLNGLGEVGWDKVFRTVFSLSALGASWLALSKGWGLVALGCAHAACNLLFLMLSRRKLHGVLPHGLARHAQSRPDRLNQLIRDGGKLLGLNLLGYAVSNYGVFVVERRFGLGLLTSFSGMLKIGALMVAVGGLGSAMSYPYVAGAYKKGDREKCRRYYLLGLVYAVGTGLAISLPLLAMGRTLFERWLGPGSYPGDRVFGPMLAFNLLYVHHLAHSTPVLAASGAAFLKPAVVNAILVVLLVTLLPLWMGLPGVPWGMIIGTLVPSTYVVVYSWRFFMRGSKEAPSHLPSHA